eukprot:c21422_g1_i4 orf=100-405(+)
MVVKNRYLVMEIFCEGEGPALTHSAITNAIKDSILHNFGEFGLGSSLTSLQGNIRCCKHATLEYDKAKVELLKLRSGKNQLSPKQLEAASSCLEKISQLEM